LISANDSNSPNHESAKKVVSELQKRGKWPAKPDLPAWYGNRGSRWRDMGTEEYLRCVKLPNDPELITRHEVQESPPDILVTNYSMLEYMLMRPIERPIFDKTRDWLIQNPDEKILLVVDEAHMYSGAGGAEVALLIRRLRKRLGIPRERLQVICTSASFQDPEYATEFGAQLTGKDRQSFESIGGELFLRPDPQKGTVEDVNALNQIDMDRFYAANTSDEKIRLLQEFLRFRDVRENGNLEKTLYDALNSYPPLNQLVNVTMQEACPVDNLGKLIFDNPDYSGSQAVTTLMALGSLARQTPNEPSLLPCRVHSFYRGVLSKNGF